MYIARYKFLEQEIVQVALSVEPSASEGFPEWLISFESTIESIFNTSWIDIAYRIETRSRCLKRRLILSCDAEKEPFLIEIINHVLKLNNILPQSVITYQDRYQHDLCLNDFPVWQAQPIMGPYYYRECALVCPFFLFPHVDDIYNLAQRSNLDIGLQVNVRHSPLTQEDIRALRKNLSRLRYQEHVPAKIYKLQHEICSQAEQATILIDEIIGIGARESSAEIISVINQKFSLTYGDHGFVSQPLDGFKELANADLLASGLSSTYFIENTPIVKSSRASSISALMNFVQLQRHWEIKNYNTNIAINEKFTKLSVPSFISYAPEDKAFFESLLKCLAPLMRIGMLDAWHNIRIRPGQDLPSESLKYIKRSKLIIFLVSADYLASEYLCQHELNAAVQYKRDQDCIMLPIIVRPTDITYTLFRHMKPIPVSPQTKELVAITSWQNEDKAWECVSLAIRKAIREIALV